MLKRVFFVPAILIIVLTTGELVSCSKNNTVHYIPHTVCISNENPSRYFSVNLTGLNQNIESVSVVYGEYNSSSLYEASFTNKLSVKHTFIDTIDRLPPVNPSFGINASAITLNARYILYLDQQTEENTILKLLYTKNKNWVTNILIPSGMPLLILNTEKAVIPIWQHEKNLYFTAINKNKLVKPVFFKSIKLNRNFDLTNLIYTPQSEKRTYFFAFDQLTKKIYLFKWRNNTLVPQAIKGINYPVYYIKRITDSEYKLLFYNKDKREIGYIDKYPQNLDKQRITLSRETTSLFFTRYKDRMFFFFNELTATKEKKPVFAISVIFSSEPKINSKSKNPVYKKCILILNEKPMERIRWISNKDDVFIVYQTPEGLYCSCINLDDLINSNKKQ